MLNKSISNRPILPIFKYLFNSKIILYVIYPITKDKLLYFFQLKEKIVDFHLYINILNNHFLFNKNILFSL